jgi:hypothetical protein
MEKTTPMREMNPLLNYKIDVPGQRGKHVIAEDCFTGTAARTKVVEKPKGFLHIGRDARS